MEPWTPDTAILHIAPVARETPVSWSGRAGFVGVTPQGLIRHWQEDEGLAIVQLDAGSLLGDIPLVPPDSEALPGRITAVALEQARLPERFDAAVIAEQECPSCHALFPAARRHGAIVAVTAGSRPTTVHLPGDRSVDTDPTPSGRADAR